MLQSSNQFINLIVTLFSTEPQVGVTFKYMQSTIKKILRGTNIKSKKLLDKLDSFCIK